MRRDARTIRVWQETEWTRFVGTAWPRELMYARLVDRLHVKQGRNIARWTLTADNDQIAVFVKRHERHSSGRSLLARLWSSRIWSDAGCEWRHLHLARAAGVSTSTPVAMAEWLTRDGLLQSALVLRELTGMVALHEAIPLARKMLSPDRFTQWKRGLVCELARMVRLLHDRDLFHQDLYLCHFFVRLSDIQGEPCNWNGRVTLIDFHRLTRRRILSLTARAKDLGQLLYSARTPGVTPQDIARFWRHYRQGRGELLRRFVMWKAARYHRHNEKRRRP